MERTSVNSTNIRSVGYDPDTQTLEIEFSNGRVHTYDHVPADEHRDLIGASSIGSHFHKRIRNNYSGSKI